MSSHPHARQSDRAVRALLASVVLALTVAACGSDVVPPPVSGTVPSGAPAESPTAVRSSAATASPSAKPAATTTLTPTFTPVPSPAVVDGPNLAGDGIKHCPGTTQNGPTGTTGSEDSTNWSGYALVSSRSVVTCVEAEWVQPKVTCHGKIHTSVSIWVGLGGFSQGRLEQVGTAIDCIGGNPVEYSWHESLPRERNEVDTPVSIEAGDRIWAQVRWLGGSSYQLSLANLTGSDGFTVRDTNKGLHRTEAEWIAEAPTGCSPTCKVLQMPNWGKVTFDHIAVTVAGVRATLRATGATRVRVRLEKSRATRAIVTETASDGSSFVVTWRHA